MAGAWRDYVVGDEVVVWRRTTPLYAATVTHVDEHVVGTHTGDWFDAKGADREGRPLRIALADDTTLAYLERAHTEAEVVGLAKALLAMPPKDLAAISPEHLDPLLAALRTALGAGYIEALADNTYGDEGEDVLLARTRWLLRP